MIGSRFAHLIVAGFVSFAIALPVSAQEFPSRTVKIVMGFGPGGLGDIAGRAIGEVMSKSIGQPVIIENMPGAGGATSALAVARATPDGHSMLWVSSQNAIAPSMFKSLPYDWARDFTPVGPMATFDFVLFVHKDSPLNTVQDVIVAAKKDPDKFNFGSIAVGTAQNLSTLQFVSMAGLKVPTVPFRTTGEVMTGLISGSIQAAFETIPGVIGQINGGQMRAIGVSSTKRNPFLPNVPTIAESGVPNYLTYSWNGMVLPAKTPNNVVMRVNSEINKAIATPEIQKRFRDLIMEPRTGTPDDLQKIYDTDVAVWRNIITEAKIQPN
ncbi:MAG: tripartite tricarboxylate transporter substrate-binding protein [Alphaproteobacteria bacterium]|nr:tripartite tricarboxylate transporter substrate-binding protein [Alphaproteobacteria bacterium]